MEFVRERELVHLRYELRLLLAEGRRSEAAPLLERLRQISAEGTSPEQDAGRGRPLNGEIARWASTFGLCDS